MEPCWSCLHAKMKGDKVEKTKYPDCRKYDDTSNCPKIEIVSK